MDFVLRRSLGAARGVASAEIRSGGMDLAISFAQLFSQVWISFAEEKRSPIHAKVYSYLRSECGYGLENREKEGRRCLPLWQGTQRRSSTLRLEYLLDPSTAFRSVHEHQ